MGMLDRLGLGYDGGADSTGLKKLGTARDQH